ncbi:hypothetical protein ACHAXA_009078 [Cyclostephanos tholiformis]|uniref:EF-hand domain-containing protein n=1 Tax=Cyclostephanos tholiformis TaxID=382380 RepID=A0ABD3SPY0_9STRA
MSPSTPIIDLDPPADEVAIEIHSGNDESINVPHKEDENKKETMTVRRLSFFSKQFDVNGDGVLDDAEMAMRNMATSGRGYLTNEQVYKMMQEQIKTHKQLFRTRRIMFVLLTLVFILALSNLGTSFAAASLAKDTTTSSNAELTNKYTNEALSTQTAAESIVFESTVIDSTDGSRRRLCTVDGDVECETNSLTTISATMCDTMITHCSRGNTVNLKRKWKNGDESSYNICPFRSGTISITGTRSRLKNSEGMRFLITKLAGGYCSITGDAVAQEVDEICEVNGDCATGLICTKNSTQVNSCKDRCDMLRFAPSRLPACYASCDHATCQAPSE